MEKPRIPGMSIKKQEHMDSIIDQAGLAVEEMQRDLTRNIASESQFAQDLNKEAEKRKTPPPIPTNAKRRVPKGTPPEGQRS